MKIKVYMSDKGYGYSMLLKSKTSDGREIKIIRESDILAKVVK